jgi:hypothetical protein
MNFHGLVHYPVLQEDHRPLRYQLEDFPVAEGIASEILSLSIYLQLEFDQQHWVAQRILDFVEHGRAIGCLTPKYVFSSRTMRFT